MAGLPCVIISMRNPYQSLLNYSFWLLGRKAYTESELLTRLKRRGEKVKLPDLEQTVAQVMLRLTELNYINDDKILENYFEYRLAAKPVGRYFFLNEMRRRGISSKKAAAAWDKRRIEEKSLALALVESHNRQLAGLPLLKKKKKIASLLASRGFSSDVVWGILGAASS
ncbi:MAG: RecX family transcriptional regulator [Patescibacteria group bacterium]